MLMRFSILNNENEQNLEGIDYPLLLNTDQIASIKRINIMYKGNIIKGYWIRMANGKKYRASRVPEEITKLLEGDEELTAIDINGQKLESSQLERSIH